MKKIILLMSLIFCLSSSIVSYAGEWRQDSTGWQYIINNGTPVKNVWFDDPSSGIAYHFDSNGYMQTGFVNINGEEYYFTELGALVVNGTTPDGRFTDGNGIVFDDFNNEVTFMLASASDIQAGICKIVVVAIKNECDKTFTVKSDGGLSSNGNVRKLYLYDVETKKFYDQKIINPNETVKLCFAASDLSEFQVTDSDFVILNIDYNGIDISSETRIQGAYRHHWSSQ